ncbi:putative disease resistance protein RGA4 [Eucalyptus grandis]|uniref:putative disease resistance protein RGA4 n=1 Tax=Eucalyptus grandis TaxID=71139 RepID=UPI00192EDC6E|nr:putative disease resistance protein RGA4 [Eucalyptus grandis]
MTEFVSSILGTLAEKLTSSAVEEIQLVCGVKDDREKLKNTLEMIQTVLADAEQKQIKDKAVRLWLSRLKNWCYDAEDALDEFEARALWRRVRSTEHLTLKRKKTRFNLSTDVHERTIVPRRETHSFVPASNVIGRNEEKERIIEMLRRWDDAGARNIEVLPIIGMGGTGKTTLAKLVYNDERVKEHFTENNQVWLSMPLEFNMKNIIRDIIKSLGGGAKFDDYNLDMLQNDLRNLVRNRRCLFVMDDVWAMSRKDWLELIDLLGGISRGSKVIVTSRNQVIAEIMGIVRPVNLANLSPKDSLTLFVKHAFEQGQEKNHPDLIKIGRQIVSKCGGNPMAVKTLGSLLYSKNNQSDWEYVRDSEVWQLETDILPSLRISYDLMPSHLKQCFVYCSIFPKNYMFMNIDLIQLWILNGFIRSSGNNKEELEEIGQQYLEELISRSFFNVVAVNDTYLLLVIEMHDLIYELAISVAKTEYSNMKEWKQDISQMTRHISFPDPIDVSKDELRDCLSKLSRVRTIMCEGELGSSDSDAFFLETCISRFKYLRVLLLEYSSFDQLPSSIGGLKHLRYLGLRNNQSINKLPKSVCELYNLQTLDLGSCYELEALPANIKNMINLRVLIITTKQQRFPESGIGCLTSLRWLDILRCEYLEALFDDIQSLSSLRKLRIEECPKLASLPQGIQNLKALEHLMMAKCESLRLPEGDSNEPGSMSSLQTLVLQELPALVSLPGWLEGSASALRMIEISYCRKLSALPEWLQNCSCLTKLELTRLPELSSLPDGVRLIPTLKLKISDCGELSSCGEEDDCGELSSCGEEDE